MDKQRRKGYSNYNKGFYQKRSRQLTLEAGMTGFLCTCNFREKECVRDAYKILEEFANEIYGSDQDSKIDNEKKNEPIDNQDKQKNDDNEEDISEALNKEIAELKAESKKPAAAKRFQNADPGTKNVIFISTTIPDPLELALSIIKKLDETKQQRTRYLIRLVPILVVCKANMPEIKTKADQLFDKYFVKEPKTFSIVFNRHSNNKVQRNEIIEELADLVSKKNPGNKADLTNPQIAVVVEVIRSFCLLSIAPEYFKYKKYNLLELCNVKDCEKPKKDGDEASSFSGENEEKCDERKDEANVEVADREEDEERSVSKTSESAEKDEANQEAVDREEDKEPSVSKTSEPAEKDDA